MTDNDRYGVQIGDDGRWTTFASKPEAVKFAVALSNRDLHRSQLVDFVTGEWMRFRDGARVA